MTESSLEFLGHQTERILQELASLRDAIDVLTAMSIRHESSIQTVVLQASAHTHNLRCAAIAHAQRLRKIEDAVF